MQVSDGGSSKIIGTASMGNVGSAQGFAGITELVSDLKGMSGGFGVSPEGGQKLISAIDALHDKVVANLRKQGVLTQTLPLGTTHGATTFKPFLSTIASDPDQGAVKVLTTLKENLESARTTIQQAMAKYEQTEGGNKAGIQGQGSGLEFI